MKRWELIVAWTLQVLLAAFFLFVGGVKLGHSPAWIRLFRHWGYPDGFYMVIGVAEVGGAILLLIPRLLRYGAALLGVVLIGAMLTNLVHREPQVLVGLISFLILAGIASLRRKSLFPTTR